MPSLRRLASASPLHGLSTDDALPLPVQEQSAAKHLLFILLLALFFGACYYFLIFNKALFELELETDTRTVLKFYWPNEQGNYSEKQSAWLLIKPDANKYAIRVTDISRLDHLRLDPSENKAANITIKRIAVQQTGFPTWQMQSHADFLQLTPLAEFSSSTLTRPDEGGIALTIRSNDPQLKLPLPAMERHIVWPDELKRGLFILLLAAGCWLFSRLLFQQLDFIPMLAFFVLALIVVMASISAVNTHPDEYVHLAAGAYYQDHTLPPKIGDPAIADTYSVYGVSRLHSGEIYYLLAGKFLQLFKPFQIEQHIIQRLFNVLLFFGLTMFAFHRPKFRPFLLPMLISPQIWYVFSYCNSDALSTAVGLIAAWQLAENNSSLNALLRDEPTRHVWFTPLLMGLLFGFLLLQKQNFYFLYVFFLIYFLWRIWLAPPVWSKRTLFRFIAIILIGGSLFAAFRLADAWVNEFRKEELMLAAREQYAENAYKPSTPVTKKHPYLQMREHGQTLRHMLDVDRWGEKSFRTAFGVYGYTQYSAPFSYYDYVRTVGLLLLLCLAASVLWKGGLPGITLLVLAGGWTALFLAELIWHAWTVDFQAQGRYLLPIVPMFAVLYYHCQRILIKPIFYSLFLLLFLLSLYNFIFVGLHDIGKAVL